MCGGGGRSTPQLSITDLGLWSGRVRGLVSNINEVAGTANICQRDPKLSSCWRPAGTSQPPVTIPGQCLSLCLGRGPTEWDRPICTQLLGQARKRMEIHTLQEVSGGEAPPSPFPIWHLLPRKAEPERREQEHLCKIRRLLGLETKESSFPISAHTQSHHSTRA